jgi:hypothetical protein
MTGRVAPEYRPHQPDWRLRSRESHRRSQPRRAACWRCWRSLSRRTRPGSAYPSSSRLQSGSCGPLRIMWTTRFRSVGVAVRHKSLTDRRVADGGSARPLGGLVHRAGAASRATAAGRLGSRRAGRLATGYPSLPYPVKTLSYLDIDPRQVTSATAGWQNPAASRLGSRACRNYSHSSSSPKSCKSAYGRWNGGVGRAPGRRGSAWAGHLATGARTSTAGWKRRAGNDPKADSRQ